MTDSTAECRGLDPAWIGDRVGERFGGTAGATMRGFIGTGQMSRNARFDLDWSDGSGPASVVVKVPSGDPGVRQVSFDHGIYGRECAFYEHLLSRVEVTTPELFAVDVDPAGPDFALILEDLSESVQGDQFRDATDAELRLAVAQAAALHAPVWGDTADAVFDDLRTDDERIDRTVEMMPLLHAVVLERIGDRLDPDMFPVLERFVATIESSVRARSVPTTLVHGDFRPDNFLFGTTDRAPALAVVDWQTIALGIGIADVAYLIAGALPPERRREVEADLVTFYRSELAARGVDYPAAQAEHDYALGAMHGIGIAVTATAMAERTERGDALFAQMINRHGRHALDVGSFDLLD